MRKPKVQHRLKKDSFVVPTTSDPEAEEALRLGLAFKQLRERRGLLQNELATLSGLRATQICALEKGRHQPSISTLRRLCAALGASLDDVLRVASGKTQEPATPQSEGVLPGLQELFATPEERLFAGLTRKGFLRTVRLDSYASPLPSEESVNEIERRLTDYLRLESLCGAYRQATIPLSHPFRTDAEGAEALASWVRKELGLGDSIVLDYVSLLESHGVRVVFLGLPRGVESLSFYEDANGSAFIILNEAITPEKQLFRMAVELAYVYLFTHNGKVAVPEAAEANRRFAKLFAACFLLPRSSVLYAAASLGAGKGDWTYPLLLRVKRHFGVSAEAFSYRLLELGLLSDSSTTALLQSIKNHYTTHQNREPGDPLPPLHTNGRLCDLLERARSIPGVYDELQAIAKHAGVSFSGS